MLTPAGPVVFTFMGCAGTEILGAESRTVTVNVLKSLLSELSLAVHVTKVLAIGKIEPEGGSQDGVIGLSILSIADTVYDTDAPDKEVASASTGDCGTLSVGGILSWL